MKRVLAFGAFDPLHDGHRYFFEQARQLGEHVQVVVARDSYIRLEKHREPQISEEERRTAVAREATVSEARLGQDWPTADPYALLDELNFDVVALGYDQQPGEERVREELARRGKSGVQVIRLKPYQPEEYKSSLLRL